MLNAYFISDVKCQRFSVIRFIFTESREVLHCYLYTAYCYFSSDVFLLLVQSFVHYSSLTSLAQKIKFYKLKHLSILGKMLRYDQWGVVSLQSEQNYFLCENHIQQLCILTVCRGRTHKLFQFCDTGWNDKIIALEKTTWFHFRLMKTGSLFLLQTIY